MAGITWRSRGGPLEWGELQLSGAGEAWRIRGIVVRFDPTRFRFRLATALSHAATVPEWSVDSAGPAAALAFNAGQFAGAAPWGWVVHKGREVRPRGRGPLAQTVLFDSLGRMGFLDDSATASAQAGGAIYEAFQTYPSLLVGDGVIPAAFGALNSLLDVGHRDSRLALGRTRDNRVLLLLTRFDGLGGQLDGVPFGLTVGETAALMGALGCGSAVALDGGISGQVLVRTADSSAVWRGWRKVPLGLIAESRP
jgi:exopolysaccharide biosynthesis protein